MATEVLFGLRLLRSFERAAPEMEICDKMFLEPISLMQWLKTNSQ